MILSVSTPGLHSSSTRSGCAGPLLTESRHRTWRPPLLFIRPGPGSLVNPAADPKRQFRGGRGEDRHRDRPPPEVACAAVGWWSRGGQRGVAPAVGGASRRKWAPG